MKVILFIIIATLALFISPPAADANLILNPGFEDSTNYWTFSNIDLLSGYHQAKEGTYSVDLSRSSAKTIWVSSGSVFNLQYTFHTTGNSRRSMGWTAATTALLFASQTDTSYGPAIDLVPVERTPDPIPASIIFFAPGLAGILVGRNWPQIGSWRRAKRKNPGLLHHVSGFLSLGNVLKRILLINRFIAYFQFVHFKLRTTQLNQ